MNGATYYIELRRGKKVAMLFTPRLYMFKGREGVTFDFVANDQVSIHSVYADIMYCAALNHWTLTHSADEEFPYQRVDFHAVSVSNRDGFSKAVIFAMQTLSGKSLKELAEDAQKMQEAVKETEQEVKKKKPSVSIMTRLRNIWSAIVD